MIRIIKTHKILKGTLCIILAYLSSLAIAYIFNLGKSSSTDFYHMLNYGYNLIAVGVFIFGVWLLLRFINVEDKRLKVFSIIAGLSLSISTVWGAYALFINDIFISMQTTVVQIFLVIGLNILFTPLSVEIFRLIGKFSEWCDNQKEDKIYSKKNNVLYFLIVWLAIFAAYIPLFLAWWPGNFIYDAKYQLSEVINNIYKTHHPLLHTWLMGTAYKLGVEWGSASKGFQLYTLLQMLVLSSSFSYCLLYLRKRGMPRLFRVISFLWFALFPMHSIFSITSTKDVLFTAFFLYTVIYFCRYFLDKEKFHWYTYVGLVVFAVLSALFRNNEIHAVLIFGLAGIIMVKGLWQKGKLVLFLLAVYLLTSLSNQFLIEALNAREAYPYRETLSVPLQGLARVANYKGGELDELEYNEIVMYIPLGNIDSYSPFISDPVKGDANEELLKSNLFNFLKLWVKIGMQYPDEYIESFVSNTMGYWYVFPLNDYVTINLSLYHTLIGVGEEIEKLSFCDWANELYFDLFCVGNYRFTPVLGYSFRMAPYVWLIIFIFLWSVMKKDKKAILVMILPLAYLATCFLGPVATLRYMYNLIVCCPVYFYLCTKNFFT